MALEKLEIYQTAFDLMVHIEECVRDFSRYFKYTVGSELRGEKVVLRTEFIEAEKRAKFERIFNGKSFDFILEF